MIKILLPLVCVFSLCAGVGAQSLKLWDCKGKEIRIEPGDKLHIGVFKNEHKDCALCAVYNMDRYDGTLVGFDGHKLALNSTCHFIQRWEPGMKALKKSTNNVRPGDSPLLTSFHEEEIGWIGYYTPGQMAMRRASGQMAKFSFAWNLLIAPSVLLIANKFTWERYLALASPGLVALGVAIPLNIKGHSSKMLTLNLPPEACDPECAGQIIANTP
jgi:hypothetical protein